MVLLFKGLVGVGFQLLFFGVLLFAPTGSLSWLHAINWLLIYAAMAFVSCAFFAFFRPKALEARMRTGRQDQPRADRMALSTWLVLYVRALLCPALTCITGRFFPRWVR